MKLYILTKTETSEIYGTLEHVARVFRTKEDAIKSIEYDIAYLKKVCDVEIKLKIKSETNGLFVYEGKGEIFGRRKIEYNIWNSRI